jgi:ferredoxin
MPLDPGAVARGCGADPVTGRQFCRAELGRVRAALEGSGALTIGCTQEQQRFEDLAEDLGAAGPIAFANLRETGGWSHEAASTGPKMAALLAAAAVPMPEVALVTLESRGVALILGRDQTAIAAGERLAPMLDITVLLTPGAEAMPPRRTVFPVLQGRARAVTGHLGAFAVTIDDHAVPDPASRARLAFGQGRDGARSECDLILDLTGGTALFAAADLRDGYLRADPRDPVAVERALFDAAQLVGTFDRPRYVTFDAGLCAHSRSGITGCTRCLDLCPAGAITPAGDSVAIDPAICAGCGQCAAACPTGAAAYALPPVEALAARLRALLLAHAEAGGKPPVVLLHDGDHGASLIDASARFGSGLPARVLPLAVNEITQIGPETIALAIAWGASAVRILGRARPRHDQAGLLATIALSARLLDALGYGAEAVGLIETDDPDRLEAALATLPSSPARPAPSRMLPPGSKRPLLEAALREVHAVAPTPRDVIDLPEGAPFGAVVLDTQACTLCLACVSACPTKALGDDPDRPLLAFTESRCVQCGLCEATCPETAITLRPQIDFPAWSAPRRVLKSEEPFHCTRCGKAFGTRSSIERVRDRLAGHWMYSGPEGAARAAVLEMCEDCRVAAVVTESFDPHNDRPVRTTADYLRERGKPDT